jgi:chemosensory pili system protein ChpA (sensor histidine kinase/response regulator)
MQTSPEAGASATATAAPDDLGHLAWVLDELRTSLQTAVRCMRRHARDADEAKASDGAAAPDGSQLRIARQQLHQSRGVLDMVELVAPALMLQAMEGAADKCVERPELCDAEAAAKVERASFALIEYLEALIAGRQASAVALFPQYAEVQKLAGAERAHPADLWVYRWRWLDPRTPAGTEPLAYSPQVKASLDPALLALIRTGDRTAAQALCEIFIGLATGQASARPRVFWKIAAAFMEALHLGLVPVDLHVKRAASRVLQQYALLAKGDQELPERLLLDLLFFCAQADPGEGGLAPCLAAVRQTYNLGRHAPVNYARVQFGLFDPALLAQARKRVASVKDIWSALSGGDVTKLKGIAEPFGALCEALVKLHPPSAPLAASLTEAIEATVRSGQAPPAELAMEVATSVLYLEAVFEDLDPSDVTLAERTARLAERLRLVGAGGSAPALEAWMEELFRRVSDRHTMGSVVGEMRGSLATLERSLDQFFRNPEDATTLRDVPSQLGHMKGVLSVLGLEQAARALSRMRESVEQIVAGPLEAGPGGQSKLFDMLAVNLGALGFMFDMLGYQPALARKLFVFDEEAGELKPVMGRRADAEPDDDALAQDEPPSDAIAKAPSAGATVPSVAPDSAPTSAEQLPPAQAGAFAPTDFAGESGDAAPAPAGTDMRPAFDFDLELGGPVPSAQAAESEIDQEMLDIFTEEATEVVQNGMASVRNLRLESGDAQELSVLRRAFHTLKGSSRMVGLTDFGEAAWAMEQLLNALVAEQQPASAQVCDLSDSALQGFGGWVADIVAGRPSAWTAAPFRLSAEALRVEGRYVSLLQPALLPALPEAGATVGTLVQADDAASESKDILPAMQSHDEPIVLAVPQPEELSPEGAGFSFDEPLGALEPPVPERAEAQAGALPAAEPVFEPSASEDDQYKLIGPLRISLGLYNIFLNEADERSRKLVTEASEWALEFQRPPGDSMVALAHSIAGSSATVGFASLAVLARLLENALLHVQAAPAGTQEQGQNVHDAAQEISRLLHQFAAGFLRDPDPSVIARLQSILDRKFAAPADLPQASADRPDGGELEPSLQLQQPTAPQAAAVDLIDAGVFPIFEEEAVELLPQLSGSLRQWIAEPGDQGQRSLVLRGLHTLKGGARLVGAMRLGEMAHHMESDIEALGSETLSKAQLEPLLKVFDLIVAHYDRLSRSVADGVPMEQKAAPAPAPVPAAPKPTPFTAPAVAAPLAPPAATVPPVPVAPAAPVPPGTPGAAATAAAVSSMAEPVAPAAPAASDASGRQAEGVSAPAARAALAKPAAIVIPTVRASVKQVRVRSQVLDQLVGVAGEAMGTGARLEVNLGNLRESLGDLSGNLERLRQQLRDVELHAELQMQSRLALTRESVQGFDPLEFDRFTRVQELTRMMAESVNDVATIQRNLLRTIVSTEDDLHAQARQTRELQRDLLRTRMVEFDGISERLHRVVRQAAGETDKQVRLELTGGSIEMDRGMLERMIPAFEHLLRNCVAHGIEDATLRIDSGKDPTGLVSIDLEQDGNDVRIKIRDDGAGLNLSRIRDKALSLGLIGADQEISDAEAANLILMPGFSTATEVTELAGRGIGMDVVRAEINAIGGRIETTSQPGHGTQFKLVLPLTTAVTQIVMLRAGELSVGVPAAMVEMVHGSSAEEISMARQSGVLALDGREIPFFWAGALLQSSPASLETEAASFPVMVLLSASQRVAIQVDQVLGHQEVVVKNLGTQLARLPGLTGVSALPAGQTVLIYNPVALAAVYGERARRLTLDAQGAGESAKAAAAARAAAAQAPLVLVVDDSITVRRVTQRLLVREGYRVALAADGFFALERLAEERPVVMLSDIEMPRMDGFELVGKVRQDPRWLDLPIIMISSRSAEKHREHARELGADDFLGKPYGEEELLGHIRKFASVKTVA